MPIISYAELPTLPWRNRAGRKAEIARGKGWALGFAWIDRDSPFSDFVGFDRTSVLIEGVGFTLDFKHHQSRVFSPTNAIHRFAGEWRATARLFDGPCLVLNIMTNRDTWNHRAILTDDFPDKGFAVVVSGCALADREPHAKPKDTLTRPHAYTGSEDMRVLAVEVTVSK